MPSWDPDIYERYKTYRDRPALDLLLQIPSDLGPKQIWDLGCGTGEHAALLAARHPEAKAHGLDSSPDMLAAARRRAARVEWIQGDISVFAPDIAPDLIYTNAALQWLPDHQTLFPRLAASLAQGGVLACQMPQSFDQPWHRALRDLAAEGPWRSRLEGIRGVRPVADPSQYYDWLSGLCAEIDIWSTTYLHVLEGDDPVVDWMRGTGLRPYLDALPDSVEREAFLEAYRQTIAAAVPTRADGVTLFPFPRLFIIARR
ncbi:MAG: methyltransferase domain-containing protein [Caulobacteraceae bacterium]|nr:methyltransferase domain-containing protein [Caulobacteraceae bacterium]